jgi:glucokinase
MNQGNSTIVGAMDIGGTHVTAANVDIAARRVLTGESFRLPLDSSVSPAEFVKTVADCAARLPFRPERRWAIALPGPFDYERGIARYEGVDKFNALSGYDLRTALAPLLPGVGGISFCNDADAFGLGEWWTGAARGYSVVAGITLGTGVGSCFLRDGRPLRDGPGIPPDGRINELLYAGKPLEETVSRDAMRRAYARATGASQDIDVLEIAQRAHAGDRAAVAVFDQAYRILGTVLVPILEAFDPQILVVGGSIAASWDLVAGPLRAGLTEDLLARIDIRPAEHPADAPLLGAAYQAAS